jgi:hypothetical protein
MPNNPFESLMQKRKPMNGMAANAVSGAAGALSPGRMSPGDAISGAADMANQDLYQPQETGLQKAGRIFGTIMNFI